MAVEKTTESKLQIAAKICEHQQDTSPELEESCSRSASLAIHRKYRVKKLIVFLALNPLRERNIEDRLDLTLSTINIGVLTANLQKEIDCSEKENSKDKAYCLIKNLAPEYLGIFNYLLDR